MAVNSRDGGINPLRPYYKPPTIGPEAEPLPTTVKSGSGYPGVSSNATTTSTTTGAGAARSGVSGSSAAAAKGQYASRAREMFPDLDYRDYVNDPSPSTVQNVREFLDELMWKYTSVLMSQPFEVAKTVLQVRLQDDLETAGMEAEVVGTPKRRKSPKEKKMIQMKDSDENDLHGDSESDDELSYFTTSTPYTPTPGSNRQQSQQQSQHQSHPLPSPHDPPKARKANLPPHQLSLRRADSIFDALSQIWTKEGAWGIWKGSNATFLYTVLSSLLENWSRSLLSALLNVPDLGLKDDVDRLVDIASPYPWLSFCVAAAAAVSTGLILAPLDLVRTRLILTTTGRAPRRTVGALRALPSWTCPGTLIVPTVLHSLVHPVLTLSTPLVLRSRFRVDRDLSPTAFSIAKFASAAAALIVKLPLETVLRRGHAAVLAEPEYLNALDDEGRIEFVVNPGVYRGVLGTMYAIVAEEGCRAVPVSASASQQTSKTRGRGRAPVQEDKNKKAEVVYRRGQGLQGLWRGWKVSWWGLVGLWGAGLVGENGEGEF